MEDMGVFYDFCIEVLLGEGGAVIPPVPHSVCIVGNWYRWLGACKQ